ncbi:Plant intracellular Ras-group-related LRR protein 5 [Dichanthelium oligosanthes]|uniref:Plant intracellular Ras-group-related LRR protein 5 n=1 Tax=Dichanthelium oligosanthes TaxID=888268 RepID=A0A1E5V953_9POAL|nr:Plant intracellular Ras-group-related LRR protein 5 [Dichanthelium oligosanthes]
MVAAAAEAVEELTRLYRELPPRPAVEEVEAAAAVLASADAEEEARLAEIAGEEARPVPGVPAELLDVLREAKRNAVSLRALLQRKEAAHVVELERRFKVFDDLIQRASRVVSPGDGGGGVGVVIVDEVVEVEAKRRPELAAAVAAAATEIDRGSKGGLGLEPKSLRRAASAGNDTEKLGLIQVASLIESSAKKGTTELNLRGKLVDQVEWLPVSLGKLQDVTELDLSENRIMALPSTIGSLRYLTKLDLHANQLINLPDTFGELSSLIDLDLSANQLKSLPASFGNLTSLANLDLSSNMLKVLPDCLGKLTNLRRLIAETNELEELPYTIGSCTSLVELRLDFNQLKALPEAIGKLEKLEILTLHYNRIKGLPTTIGQLNRLRELDVSFNEVEMIPENICFASSLVKLNVSRNFADLRSLPKSIGELEMLEELDISSNQIRVLPDSFGNLSKLRVFHADETPLEVPPKEAVKLGAQEVVNYMKNMVAARGASQKETDKRSFWAWLSSLFGCCRKDQGFGSLPA